MVMNCLLQVYVALAGILFQMNMSSGLIRHTVCLKLTDGFEKHGLYITDSLSEARGETKVRRKGNTY